MHTYGFFIITFLLLVACSLKEPATDQSKSSTISIEQQKQDALAILEMEKALLEGAQVDHSQAESSLFKSTELESEQNEQILIELAKSEKAAAEQGLIESAKLESDKMKALLNQAANGEKIIQTPDDN